MDIRYDRDWWYEFRKVIFTWGTHDWNRYHGYHWFSIGPFRFQREYRIKR